MKIQQVNGIFKIANCKTLNTTVFKNKRFLCKVT